MTMKSEVEFPLFGRVFNCDVHLRVFHAAPEDPGPETGPVVEMTRVEEIFDDSQGEPNPALTDNDRLAVEEVAKQVWMDEMEALDEQAHERRTEGR